MPDLRIVVHHRILQRRLNSRRSGIGSAHEELLDGAYMTPTYGNTLMGLAGSVLP